LWAAQHLRAPDIQGCVPRDNFWGACQMVLSETLPKRLYAKCYGMILISMMG
jgi:hypothetical protein